MPNISGRCAQRQTVNVHSRTEIFKEEILQEAGFEQRLMEELKDLRPVLEEKGESLNTLVHKELERHKEYHWTKPVQQVAKDLVNKRIS